jgi:hypothetical protein
MERFTNTTCSITRRSRHAPLRGRGGLGATQLMESHTRETTPSPGPRRHVTSHAPSYVRPTFLAFHTRSTGMPASGDEGSSSAAELTTSFEPVVVGLSYGQGLGFSTICLPTAPHHPTH